MTTPDQQHGTPEDPPTSQQEVIASALADIVTMVEQSQTLTSADAREAGWLALELIESV